MAEAEGSPRPRLIVKFSPTIDTRIGQRWSNLLVTEHLAHQVLGEAGIRSAQSRIEHFDGRTFLETDRFDRAGPDGRIGVTSLLAIDTHLYGELDNWVASATRLHRDHRIDSHDFEAVRLVAAFGALIANTDRHFGNLAFLDRYDGRFTLAPIYDTPLTIRGSVRSFASFVQPAEQCSIASRARAPTPTPTSSMKTLAARPLRFQLK